MSKRQTSNKGASSKGLLETFLITSQTSTVTDKKTSGQGNDDRQVAKARKSSNAETYDPEPSTHRKILETGNSVWKQNRRKSQGSAIGTNTVKTSFKKEPRTNKAKNSKLQRKDGSNSKVHVPISLSNVPQIVCEKTCTGDTPEPNRNYDENSDENNDNYLNIDSVSLGLHPAFQNIEDSKTPLSRETSPAKVGSSMTNENKQLRNPAQRELNRARSAKSNISDRSQVFQQQDFNLYSRRNSMRKDKSFSSHRRLSNTTIITHESNDNEGLDRRSSIFDQTQFLVVPSNFSDFQSSDEECVSLEEQNIPQSPKISPVFLKVPSDEETHQHVGDHFKDKGADGDKINDADFESDSEFVSENKAKVSDVKTMYNKACQMVGVVSSHRIERELVKERVYLDYCGLNTGDVKAICIALLCNTRINRLDLSGNDLSEHAARYISDLIKENIFITHLSCATCQLRENGVGKIIGTVSSSKNITVLDLSENKLQDEQVDMVAAMLKKNNTLRELRLSYCDIDEEGGKILAPVLADSSIEKLDLSWNQLRQKGGAAFCLALGDNDSIRELDLSWNGLGREGCAGLEMALEKNNYLVQLNLECNRINTVCLTHVLKGLEKNSTLETLYLARNPISMEDAKLIASFLTEATRSAIKVLDISDITVDEAFESMQERLQSSRGVSIYHGNLLQRPKKELKQGPPRTLASYDPILVLFEYMKQQNLRLIDLFRSLDVNHDHAISKEELRNGFRSLNMDLPEGVLSAAFDKLDLNSNNLIDIDELKNAHRRVIRQTALMMLRSKTSDPEDSNGDILHEFQKLVRLAANNRKTPRPNQANQEEQAEKKPVARKLSARYPVNQVRRPSNLTPDTYSSYSPSFTGSTKRGSLNPPSTSSSHKADDLSPRSGQPRHRNLSISSAGSSPRSRRSSFSPEQDLNKQKSK